MGEGLAQPEGFESYEAIQQWLSTKLGIEAPYKTVHKWVYYRLGASPKVVRPKSDKQDEAQLSAYKKLAETLAMLAFFALTVLNWREAVRFFCRGESRFGLKTLTGRRITAIGVKPVGKVRWTFKATYLYGVVEPATGEHFFYEFTHCNTECFQRFLKLVAQQYPESILILQVDQAGLHKARRLQVPDNIILMFQPADSPECSPIEQVWQYLKKRLRWKCLKTLDELRQLFLEQLLTLTSETVASITGRASILEALSVARI
ncbi:MAG: IS630 family transposase [Cyanobacteria bacterium P01_H01_bin.152]